MNYRTQKPEGNDRCIPTVTEKLFQRAQFWRRGALTPLGGGMRERSGSRGGTRPPGGGRTRMGSRWGLVLAVLLAFSLVLPAAQAQGAAASIEGRVFNASNGIFLNNARVSVEGSRLETFTNENGEFRLEGVAPLWVGGLITSHSDHHAVIWVAAGWVSLSAVAILLRQAIAAVQLGEELHSALRAAEQRDRSRATR